MVAPRLVLDFDGVVCDALDECALVTWLGVHPPSPRVAVSRYLTAMPRGFADRFRNVRDYSRVLAHFLVAHRPVSASITTQARFDTVFACIAGQYVRDFVRAATAARVRCRTEETDFWLDLHTLYPGVPELLRDNAGAVAIVTAKDEDSVRTILARRGLDHTVGDVIGECGRKDDAVRDLCARHGVRPETVTFVDDNLANVRAVGATGARVRWATWGYHTNADIGSAKRDRVETLSLAEIGSI